MHTAEPQNGQERLRPQKPPESNPNKPLGVRGLCWGRLDIIPGVKSNYAPGVQHSSSLFVGLAIHVML